LKLNPTQKIRFITTLILFAFYLAYLIITFSHSNIIDDAFITYRYAHNFSEGYGLVYNLGENVLGTTTPGYALFIGTIAMLFGANMIPLISISVNLMAVILLMIPLTLAVYRLSNQSYYLAILSPLLIIASRPTIFEVSTGMEAPVFVLLITSCITLIIYRHWRTACLIAGITIWIRPEGVFLIGLVGLTLLFMVIRRQLSWRYFGVATANLILPSVAYFLMLTTFYGTYLPQSIVSKVSGLYEIPFTQQFIKVMPYVSSPFVFIVDIIYDAEKINPAVLLPIVVVIALFTLIVGSIQIVKIDKVLWIIPAFLTINIIFYLSRTTLLLMVDYLSQ